MSQKANPRKKPKSGDANKWKLPQDRKRLKTAIFVRPYLDDYGLDVYEFRVLAHIARRASTDRGCFEKQKNIADFCGINQRKVMQALKTLCQANILSVERTGRSNIYRINEASEWVHPSQLEKIRQGTKPDKVATPSEAVPNENLQDWIK
ncbi:helix-turn-helix domain-containing protein [Microseira sp. BLCC-F43]|jgi:hypothetical protein|uniref:helix-turn-helix domain-containing protein n=1 Tax=Microseira sp. BLCC-F43 TaxID=3153602 RepID=UPI0035BB3816